MSVELPAPGTKVIVRWEQNPKGGVKANRLGEERTRKIVLVGSDNGFKPKPEQTWLCEVERVTNPKSETRGAILVKPVVHQVELTFKDVWIDPVHAHAMAVVLQNRRKNLFLEGQQGVGKSTIARAISEKLGRVFVKIEGSQIKKATTIYGKWQPRPGSQGLMGFDWADSKLIALIRRARSTPDIEYQAMIDEYTRIDEDARDGFLPVIEGRERLVQTPKPEELEVPENIFWMAGGNVGDSFTVKAQDDANTDRWEVFEITHMPPDKELEHCLRLYPAAPRETFSKGLDIVCALREILQVKMSIRKTISTRRTESLAMFLAGGVELPLAMNIAVANQFRGRMSDSSSERSRVATKIAEAIKGRDIRKS